MLEHYFVRPQSVDRLRALWLGPAIDRYAEWLVARLSAKNTALRHLWVLIDLNRFATSRGVRRWEELPALVDDFVRYRFRRHGSGCRTAKARRTQRSQSRAPVEQLLRLIIPGYIGTERRLPWPFRTDAPGFQQYLRDERGLRPETMHRYAHYLRGFESYLQRGEGELAKLSPAALIKFLTGRGQQLQPGGLRSCSGVLRVFLRYLHRQGTVPKDLSMANCDSAAVGD
jgi:integrase/recombinase XerD